MDGSALSSSGGHHQGGSWGVLESSLTTGVKAGGSSMTVRSHTAQQVDGNAARVSKDASPALTPLCPSGVKRMEEVKGDST